MGAPSLSPVSSRCTLSGWAPAAAVLLPRVRAKPGAQPGHGEGLSEGHHTALTLSGAELRRLCLEVPEAQPCPVSWAPARRAGQREDAPCRRARREETANESPAAGGGASGRKGGGGLLLGDSGRTEPSRVGRGRRAGGSTAAAERRAERSGHGGWEQLRKRGWGVGVTFHRRALEAGLESGLHPEAAETLRDRAQGLPGSAFILSRPFYSGRGFQNNANQTQTQASASHTAAAPGESTYVVMAKGTREAI